MSNIVIDRVFGINAITEIDDFTPPPVGIPIYKGEDTYIVGRAFIDHYSAFYKAQDAVREKGTDVQ